ncbi:MAG: class I SAM-dependent methyltransferase [Terracidiphilus sp.]
MHLIPVLKWALALAAAAYLPRQVSKPGKWVGRPFAWLMNVTHSRLTDWGLRQISLEKDMTILDVGCGGGRTIQKLAAVADKVFGIDYAAGSVAASRAKNADLIRAGRVEVIQAPVSRLPFPECTFDLVTAVETQYYWPNLSEDMREILRVLKPGGRLTVIAETYKRGRGNSLLGPAMKLLGGSNLSVDEQRELFAKAGYTDISIIEEGRKGWICAIGRKGHPGEGQTG